MCDKLDEAARARLQGLTCRSDNFEIDTSGGTRCDSIDLPGGGLANTDFSLADTR